MNRIYGSQKELASILGREKGWVCGIVGWMQRHRAFDPETMISRRMIHLEKAQAWIVQYGSEFRMEMAYPRKKARRAKLCETLRNSEG